MTSEKSSARLRAMTSRWLFILVVASSLLLSSLPLYSGSFSSGYDRYFQKYGRIFAPEYDWRWWKAQAIQESFLDPEAVSPAGAQGLMQVMPGTWLDETERLGIIASPFNPKVNVMVGMSYMQRMLRFWKAPRPKGERLELAQASYNAGAGNILQAQIRCGNSRSWRDISPCLVQVTGRHSRETLGYVERIKRWYGELVR